MKKLFFTFALLGLFALAVPKDANAITESKTDYGGFPGTHIICGHTCFCWDTGDYAFYMDYYC